MNDRHLPPGPPKDRTIEDAQGALRRYISMQHIRRTELAIAERYSHQQMRCPTHLSVGQEGVAVGVCDVLRTDDQAFSNHRNHAHYLAKGGDLDAMVAELHGKATGCAGGKGGSMHLVDLDCGFMGAVPIVSATIPLAVGAAFTAKRRRLDHVVVTFFGEAATEEGVFHEALNLAALHELPVLFVCEDNRYSVYSNMDVRQSPKRDNHAIVQGHGIPTEHADGNDAEAVAHTTTSAIEQIRDGHGPQYLQFDTYRWLEHCGPDDDNDLGYRSRDEYVAWKPHDPVARQAKRLRDIGQLDDERDNDILARIDAAIDTAFRRASEAPWPEAERLHKNVYPANRKGQSRQTRVPLNTAQRTEPAPRRRDA